MELKVFKMDAYSWVCAKSKEEAKEWYLHTSGLTESELSLRECDLDEKVSNEVDSEELMAIMAELESGQEISIVKSDEFYLVSSTFRKMISELPEEQLKSPFEIASTEW